MLVIWAVFLSPRVSPLSEFLAARCSAPSLELKKLEAIFRHKVFRMLLAKGKITREMIAMLSKLRHSCFHVFCGNRIISVDNH
jgi:hypothetical protein